jgi:restriction system protein
MFAEMVATSLGEFASRGSMPMATAEADNRDGLIIPRPVIQFSAIDLLLYKELVSRPELLRQLNWRLFEELLADILETFGYRVDLMKGTKDGGIDIVAFSTSGDFGEEMYLLQAKRWKRRVGVAPVRQLLFCHSDRKATRSCLATTGEFTGGAWTLAGRYKWQLGLRDFEGLQSWVQRALLKKVG